jgi:hypothetical protein
VVINGQPSEATPQNGHIVLPATSLHVGQNSVKIEFTSHAGPAGKPVIQYEDKDDGSEYVYMLFVPMDASMAFPCYSSVRLRYLHPANRLWPILPGIELFPDEGRQGYFGFCQTPSVLKKLEEWMRHRLRAWQGGAGDRSPYADLNRGNSRVNADFERVVPEVLGVEIAPKYHAYSSHRGRISAIFRVIL